MGTVEVAGATPRSRSLPAVELAHRGKLAVHTIVVKDKKINRGICASGESLELTRNQYKAGIIDDLSVAVNAATALSAERNAVKPDGQSAGRQCAGVAGLGGKWKEMPTGDMAAGRPVMPDATNAAP